MTKQEMIETISRREKELWARLQEARREFGDADPETMKVRQRWFAIVKLMDELGIMHLLY